ncbi:MAG: GMC family oxidoreductase [Vicinamibacterales bacterium]
MRRRDFIKAVGIAPVLQTARARQSRLSSLDFDYIVVGAGSTGCVVVNRLSTDPSIRVLLVEAGGPDNGDATVTTPGRWVNLIGSSWDWGYSTEAEPGLSGRRITFPRGKVFGGSSAINAMTFVRGHRLDFDAWCEAGNPGWGYRDLLPLFKRSETNSRGSSEFHGGEGPLAVSDTTDPHVVHAAFLDAARELGYQSRPDWDFNGAQQEGGAGYYQKNIKDGRRHSAGAAFLSPALSRRNLTVHDRAQATELTIEGRRVVGVEYVRNGQTERARAAREVILCGGVIDSPKLLLLSGIGPADHLRSLGVPVVVDLPGVGSNLQDHLKISVRWRGRQTLPASTVSAGLFVHSEWARVSAPPDLQFYVGRGLDQPDTFATLTVALQRPSSRGDVRLRSANPLDPAVIRGNYLRESADVEALAQGVALMRTFGATQAFAAVRGEETEPGSKTTSQADLAAFVRRAVDTIYHPAGTCRMGRDADAVVDANLKVRGLERLRVADASIMPNVVNATTHAACVMIGEKVSDLISEGE